MVFDNVLLIHGVALPNKEALIAFARALELEFGKAHDDLAESLDLYEHDEQDPDDDDLYTFLSDHFNRHRWPKLWTPPCCASQKGQSFVVGTLVSKIPRLTVKCDECGEYTCCERCLGATVNGVYDINAMFNDFQHVPSAEICRKCHYDRCDVDGSCKKCYWHNIKGTVRDASCRIGNRAMDDYLCEHYDPQYYRTIDDCTSCS